MLKARKSIIVIIAALFVFASFGMAQAFMGQQSGSIDGLAAYSDTGYGPVHNFVNPGGLGQVLLSQYYNARAGMVTYFTVVNTASVGQRVRVRIREGADVMPNGVCSPEEPRGSFEVLDFDICLSKNDMWSGYIKQNGTGGGMLCNLYDTDTMTWGGDASAVPQVFYQMAHAIAPQLDIDATHGCIPFAYGSNGLANGNITADQTLEGYFEVIGENELNDSGLPAGQDILTCNPYSTLAADHVCNTVNSQTCTAPDNSLTGNVVVVNGPNTGTFTYDSTAIADFTTRDIWTPIVAGSQTPNLDSGTDHISGVNYILTKENLFSIYDLQATPSKTEYSVTFPTKWKTQQCGTGNDIFDDTTVKFVVWDDKENTPQTSCSVSPCPPGTTNHLPYEVNVIQMNATSNMLPSNVVTPVTTNFTFGWFDLDMGIAPQKAANPSLSCPGATCHETCLPGIEDPLDIFCSEGLPGLGLFYLDLGNGFWTGVSPMQYNTNTGVIDLTPVITAPQ